MFQQLRLFAVQVALADKYFIDGIETQESPQQGSLEFVEAFRCQAGRTGDDAPEFMRKGGRGFIERRLEFVE
jgi:hypothetical protein